jgi:hypothetical protein
MVEPRKHLRNAAIVLALALGVWLLPGGGIAADVIGYVLSVLLLGGLAFFGYRLYMEHRSTLFDLPDRPRTILYASAAVATIAFVATSRMWNAGGLAILLWFALLGGAFYGVYTVFRAHREYDY